MTRQDVLGVAEARKQLPDLLAGFSRGSADSVFLGAHRKAVGVLLPVRVYDELRGERERVVDDAIGSLRAGEIDLAITVAPGKPGDREGEGIKHHHLLEDPMYLVLPEDHPLAHKRGIKLADMADEPWIGGAPNCECNKMITQACMRFGFDPRIAFETDDYSAVQGFVAAGVGVSLIAELGLRTVRDDIVVRSLGRDTPVRQIFATALKGYRSPATAAMIELLREVGQENAGHRPVLELVS